MTGRQGVLQQRAPTKNPDSKTPSDIFYVGLLTCARRGLIWGLVRRQAGEEQFDHRLVRIRAACSIFWAWFYAVTSISAPSQRASSALPKSTFHACAMRKHFTRRSFDRSISCLRDSADISPPGQLARLARSDLGLGLFTVKRQRLTRRGIAFSWRRPRYCFTTNTRLCG